MSLFDSISSISKVISTPNKSYLNNNKNSMAQFTENNVQSGLVSGLLFNVAESLNKAGL
ncbi:hypothetical protein DDB_G0282401 [Dictyostelium discoideum AX4]|uniref:Uncharacterized protein n=1 Tax=Dictyostelium discoideum TaxID=44689 RepID=Q54SL3_DICDI|nr:hypothetical protein DDB_G0282401 [Dictyostelium discoideum AX4]EAL66060.1 hypothetical protein DDB_G0282401 [Dictyostelium discoideum AX4]|eukprot:XP_640026.1 hypothetical protein DDB_G0282401 [Dictyostelium discoideum AX4]